MIVLTSVRDAVPAGTGTMLHPLRCCDATFIVKL
jgi:hypothetical protein